MIASSASGLLSNSPSIAASVAGCFSASSFPCRSPVGKIIRQEATSPAMTPVRSARRACSRCTPESIQNAPTPATTNEAVTTEAVMLWRYCQMAQGFRTKAQKSASCSRPSGATVCPTGFCMKALVAMMK